MSYLAPTTLADLTDALRRLSNPWLIAGGTDLLIGSGALPEGVPILDLGRLADLQRLEMAGDTLVLGAGVRVARLADDPLVRRHAPALADAADQFGSVQIRNRATLGGNVAHGAAAADLTPALMAMATIVVFLTPEGPLETPLATALATRLIVPPRAVITALRLPLRGAPLPGAFVKLGRRQEPTISQLTLAAHGQWGKMVLVAGALGPVPRRLTQAEAALNADDGTFAQALSHEVAEAIPGRASIAYKSAAITALGLDLLARLRTDRGRA